MKLEDVILRDTRANQPLAADTPPGTLYCVTDEGFIVERNADDQSAWEEYSPTTTGDVSGPGVSVNSEIALFNGTDGDTIKRATGTGFVKVASGVYQTPNAAVDLTTEVTGDLPFANLAQASAASKVLGRGSASGAGDYQELSLGSGLSMSGTTLSATGTLSTTGSPATGNLTKFSAATTITNADLTGDVTTSGTVATTIANDAVTYAKIQNVSAASRVLGRGSAGGSGDTEELSFGTGLAVTGTTISATGGVGNTAQFGITIDGGGAVITTGVKGFIQIPVTCTIVSWTLLSTDAASTAGSIVIDVWKDTYANYPPVDADSITASAPPTLSGVNANTDSTLTGWSTGKNITAGDVIGFNVDSATTVTRVTLMIKVTT